MKKHFLSYLETTIKKSWDAPAMTDIDSNMTYSYGDLAERIARLQVLFSEMGLKKGDKIAICGRNSSDWATTFLAVAAYEAVVVSIMPDFPAESVHSLVEHSEAKVLFAGPVVWKAVDIKKMPSLDAVISLEGFELMFSKQEKIANAYNNWNKNFEAKYPKGFLVEDIKYPTDNFDDLVLINYTSGTTSSPKGVMLTHKNISSNVQFGQENIPNQPHWNVVSMLPLAHMFGLVFECLYQLAGGCHVFFLSKTPSPQVLMKAFADVKPYMVLTVPLVIEKIFRKSVFPTIHRPLMRVLWYIPGIGRIIKNKVKEKVLNAFGGKLQYLIIGGAALNKEVELCLKAIHFPYCVGYGMTECAPLLAYQEWKGFKPRSCGKIVDRMEVKIDSKNPSRVPGEILVRGENTMLGYYKNQEATDEVLIEGGWLKTGDMGIIDRKGNIFIKGRCKNMILGASGQNIYPEEIEDKLNSLPGVVESIIVERDGKLVGLVYPDPELKNAASVMEQNIIQLNKVIPTFCKISKIELVEKEFEKTPKRSIKRFMYK